MLRLNTGNRGKADEFRRLFAAKGIALEIIDVDLPEIEADDVLVAVHKASQVDEQVLVEDTSLHIEGHNVGVNVRWFLDHLDQFVGCRAHQLSLLAQRCGDKVYVYSGEISGTIVEARGDGGFGFDPHFLPDGQEQTLAQNKPDHLNARAIVVDAFVNDIPLEIRPPLYDWSGPWQKER